MDLTQLPVAGLDGLSRADLEREITGAIYVARLHVQRHNGPVERSALASLYRRARAEHIKPFWKGGR